MKLAIIAACLYPDRKPIHFLTQSCIRQNISLLLHGVGSPFPGWSQMLISHTLPSMIDLKEKGYTHVLYTDGSDSIIIAPACEIERKYREAGSPPCFMSADSECFPPYQSADQRFVGPEPWRYVNGGGFVTEIDFFVGAMRRLAQKYAGDGNYQSWIVQEWPIEGFVLDHFCTIFQPMDGNPDLVASKGRLLNNATMTKPCVLHFRGGYCDPVTGRDERIEPVWRQLYEGGA